MLLLAGLAVLAVGTVCLYAKVRLFDSHRLASTAVSTLDRAEVRTFIAQEAANQLIARVPALNANRPSIQTATNVVVASDQFKSLFRGTIISTEQALLGNGIDSTVMQLQNVGGWFASRLRSPTPSSRRRSPPT